MSLEIIYQISTVDSPFWSFAIHDGHTISEDLKPYMNLSESERLREEDPHTAAIGDLPINQFVVATSRFQLDLNRNLENAIYQRPEQAWGLKVFSSNLPETFLAKLHKQHQSIYSTIESHIENTIRRHGYFVVLDIHSYNAKRESAEEVIDEENNPQINLGTYYNSSKWQEFIHAFSDAMKSAASRQSIDLDIRENIKFKGGNLAQHIIKKCSEYGCVISIEFRKDFMDEWSGEVYHNEVVSYNKLLKDTVSAIQSFIKPQK